MERTISTRRVYQLAPYQVLEVVDETSNLPTELALDEEFMRQVKYLQLIELESQYYSYLNLSKQLENVIPSERYDYLKEAKTNVFTELKNYLFNKPEVIQTEEKEN